MNFVGYSTFLIIEKFCTYELSQRLIFFSLQIGFFPEEKAFALRYQTAGMLENVLRVGVLGEDDTGEDSPK
jgi:hypothetical protein